MHESAFEINDNIAIYDGYTDGTHWNGWACPWFTKETALEIADAHNALMNEFNALLPNNKAYAIYNKTEDTFIFYGYDEAETEEFKGEDFTINGKTLHLYPIGNNCWIWDDIADFQTRDSKTVWNYLRSTYFYLNSKELYIIYHGILSEINGYMTMRELELYTDAFVRGYEAHKEVDYSLSK